ncbi:unnamed protein product [Paramecium pentaurelia]|uniref:Uncharacterized protein n=1 Tax=Paramecium pentaurelia TaxID=43138 RepID=A0A8S1SJZ3_9CILI|nr:unnamed protein product [Paramecium pentaurelia]
MMVIGGEDGIVKLWKVQNWEPILEFIGHTSFIWTVKFQLFQSNYIILNQRYSNLEYTSEQQQQRIY